jgi:hypothetical protein
MPLLDHFHPPLHPIHHWESFHSNWATRIADALSEHLPPDFLAEEHTHAGGNLQIDVATMEQMGNGATLGNGATTATVAPAVYAPPAPALTMPAVFPDSFEVRVFSMTAGLTLVGAIELVSPGNKDRDDARRAFATKVASYLYQGVSVIVVDIVTSRRGNLHNDTMRMMAADAACFLDAEELYAVAYRPVTRGDKPQIDLWTAQCALGAPLPTLPLRLTGDLFVPVDFESTYEEACRRRHLR